MLGKRNSFKSVDVFLTLDRNSVDGYFNKNDSSPMYKRQLSAEFEEYIEKASDEAGKEDLLVFKLFSSNEKEQQLAEPLMYSLKKHFTDKKDEANKDFLKFKKRNGGIIVANLMFVTICNLILPYIMSKDLAYEVGIKHFLEVFWFVIFYHPLTELLFNWNSHVKKIKLLNKITEAEYVIVEKYRKLQIV